jgi:hypothetical protein
MGYVLPNVCTLIILDCKECLIYGSGPGLGDQSANFRCDADTDADTDPHSIRYGNLH